MQPSARKFKLTSTNKSLDRGKCSSEWIYKSYQCHTTILLVAAKMGFSRGPKVSAIKRRSPGHVEDERPAKRLKPLLMEDDTSNKVDKLPSREGGALVRSDESEASDHGFKVNHEFARRFEHNKKREELQKRE